MSTESRKPSTDKAPANLPVPIDRARSNPPVAPDGAAPENKQALADCEREYLIHLFDRASAAHELAKQGALQFCHSSLEAGIALLEAHGLCPKGTWALWLENHFAGSQRTAQRYMKQAKAILMGGYATDLSHNPPEELAWQFTAALARLDRQRAVAAVDDEKAKSAGDAPVVECVTLIECDNAAAPPADEDSLAVIIELCEQAMAALEAAIESGRRLDDGRFMLDELERIHGDLDACRLLLGDGR